MGKKNQTKINRIVVSDYDPVSNYVRLHDETGKLSDIMIPIALIENWRYETDSNRGTKVQLFMRYIKVQGGKKTIIDEISRFNEKYIYGEVQDGRKQ